MLAIKQYACTCQPVFWPASASVLMNSWRSPLREDLFAPVTLAHDVIHGSRVAGAVCAVWQFLHFRGPMVVHGKNEPNYGLTRMALKLGPCFSRFTFPIAIAVLRLFELMARLG